MNEDWRELAACVGAPPDWFDEDALECDQILAVQLFCRKCPVRKFCIQDAVRQESRGVRGGLTAIQRDRRPAWGPEDDRLFALYETGLTDRDIALRVGMNGSTIARWRKRRDIPPNYPQGTMPPETRRRTQMARWA